MDTQRVYEIQSECLMSIHMIIHPLPSTVVDGVYPPLLPSRQLKWHCWILNWILDNAIHYDGGGSGDGVGCGPWWQTNSSSQWWILITVIFKPFRHPSRNLCHLSQFLFWLDFLCEEKVWPSEMSADIHPATCLLLCLKSEPGRIHCGGRVAVTMISQVVMGGHLESEMGEEWKVEASEWQKKLWEKTYSKHPLLWFQSLNIVFLVRQYSDAEWWWRWLPNERGCLIILNVK